jgi:hypothetical protein
MFFPVIHCHQPYLYDFVKNNAVYPDYEAEPYRIEFAPDEQPPDWLRIENNQLIADDVPELTGTSLKLNIVISNTAGGSSDPLPLILTIMK